MYIHALQVWRQINVMYKEMMESAKALDKLHKQNEAYVNGTTTTMDGMESKVNKTFNSVHLHSTFPLPFVISVQLQFLKFTL